MSKKRRYISRRFRLQRRRTTLSRRGFLAGSAAAGSLAWLVGCSSDASDDESGTGPGGKNDDVVTDTEIVRAAIFPGIGVARVGNSEGAFSIGPEVVEPPLTTNGQSRDAAGALKRQAARFRIYGFNQAGQVVAELTADNADIAWQVHMANRKAQWYRFIHALDIPEAAGSSFPRRNAAVTGAARDALAIDPGPVHIQGRSAQSPELVGDFQGTPVSLGQLRTDDAGRLLVLGGTGRAESPTGTPVFVPEDEDTFNNADGWFDDTSDGPVTATVTIEGHSVPVDPAWVVVTPPNFAPDVISWRTMHDLLTDVYIEAGMLPEPQVTSFTRDILPILSRLSNLQWVNKGFSDAFGAGSAMDFEDPEFVAKLADPTADAQIRRDIRAQFRPPNPTDDDKNPWPWIYGDAFGSFDGSPRENLGLSPVRAAHLSRWVEGDFIADFDPDAAAPSQVEDVPLAEQPDMLNRAALHYCLADAFHPGCELTWPMRHATLYTEPFRIAHRPAGQSELDLGNALTDQNVFRDGGPLFAQGPGGLTRWMALPWHGDTAFCRSGYEPEFDPFIPTFWPARVPNHVLTEQEYNIVINRDLSREQRLEAFRTRRFWLRALAGEPPAQMHQMIAGFGRMGVIEARPGIEDDPDFPEVMFVETLVPGLLPAPAPTRAPSILSTARERRLAEAGWESEEQLAAFRKMIGLDE